MSARYTGGLVYNAPGGWSGYFNGSSQYLNCGDQTAYEFGSGAFTIEAWVYLTSFASTCTIASKYVGGNVGASEFVFWVTTSGVLAIALDGGGGEDYIQSASGAIALNNWYHVAVCKSGSTVYLFANGNLLTSGTSSRTLNSTSTSLTLGGITTGSSLTGYISNLRILKGTALYTASFTPPSGALQPITNTSLLTCAYPTFIDGSTNAFTLTAVGATVSTVNPFPTSQLPNPALGGAGNGVYTMSQYAALKAANLWPAFDPFYKNVTLNLHGNGTNAAQNNTFLDSSTNNFTITRNGNTTQGTFTPYGSMWSNYFDGSGDFLQFANGTANVGSSDFSFEAWVYPVSAITNVNLMAGQSDLGTVAGSSWTFNIGSSASVAVYIGGGDYGITAPSPTVNAWNHVVFCRTGGTLSTFLNGVRVATRSDLGTGSVNTGSTSYPPSIGAFSSGANPFPGYISNLRRIIGSGGYSATSTTLTVPTAPLTAVANTNLLTCQSNRFVDNSTNAYAITRNGDVSVQRFSPFSPTTAYVPSVIGGSGYFDGTGDYLTLSSNASLGFGTGAYTVECWIYVTAAPAFSVFFAVSTGGLQFGLNSAGNIAIAEQNVDWRLESSTPPVLNAWNHVAATRDGSSATKLFLNGVQIASNTNTTNYVQGTTGNINLNPGNANKFTGYMTDLRVVKGTAIYTGAFTPPSAPLTAITNTSLLTNFTNAAIFDNSMMTDWETLGGAQLNTTFKKYGSGSISMLATGDYCRSTQPSTVGDINGGDFTIEFWVYFTSVAAGRALISKYGNTAENAGGLGYVLQFQQSIPSLRFVLGVGGGTDAVYDFAWSPVVSTWYHVAVTRSGSSARAFINGSQIGSTTTVSISDVASPNGTQIGKTHTVAQYLLGYMDDVRVTKGVARYTANFTPPTSQVQDQ